MAGKISEYTPVTSANDDDLIDISVHLGGGIYETRSIEKSNLVQAIPAGSSGDVQYNLAGAFAGDSTLGIDDDGLIKVTSSATIASSALGVMKLRYDDITDTYIMSTSSDDYVLNLDRVLEMKDVDYGVGLNLSTFIFDSVDEDFKQILTVEDVSILDFGQSDIVTQQQLNDVLQDGYQLVGLTVLNNGTASATVNLGTTLGGSEVLPSLVIGTGSSNTADITELTKIVALDGVDVSIFIDALSWTNIDLTVIQQHKKIR